MDVVGITFDGELKDHIVIRSLKINKWIDPDNLSLDVIFRLTVEHKYGEDGFKKIRQLYVYFREKDLKSIVIEPHIVEMERKRLEKSLTERSEERKLQEKISPLEGYIYPILTRKVIKEDDGEKKRIKVVFRDYDITEKTKKRFILFPLRFKKSIVISDKVELIMSENPWYYDCVIEPYLVQTLKWNKKEFMPLLEMLRVWLQIPKKLYGSLSAVNIQPVGHFEQMFLLEKEMAEKFQEAGQLLAQEDTLCINWSFSDISISSPPEEIEVTCRLRQFKVEKDFIKRFNDTPGDSILILRELLYLCRVQTIDFNYITSGVSDKNLQKILEIFDTMVFRKNLRPMKRNLDLLLPLLKNFRDFSYGEEFFCRYDMLNALLSCRDSGNFFSEEVSSELRQIQESEDILDPDYIEFMKDINDLTQLTKKFNLFTMDADKPRYKDEVLSKIDNVESKWSGRLIHPDRHILYRILINWKRIIEKEYEDQVPKPQIDVTMKTKRLAFADKVGIVLSIRNTGKGKAKEIKAKLLHKNDYGTITEESEIKAYLMGGGKSFEPELIINPKRTGKIIVSCEIFYRDALGREIKHQFEEPIKIIKKEISFQKIENPYIIGDIVREKRMFYGREKLITDIIDNLKGKYQTNPVFLYGQRRTGKSSILYQLKDRLRDDFSPILLNTLEIFGKKSFYEDLIEKITKELGFTDIELPHIWEDPFDQFKDEFYDKIRNRLNGKKMILMIDEYHKIDEFIANGNYDDSVIDFLSALVQEGEIELILAGYLRADELQNTKWMDLMRMFITMNVSFLIREDAIRLIREPVEGKIDFDDGAVEKIISLSACHPYFVQLICHEMVEHHNHDKANLIGYENVIVHLSDYFEKGHNILLDIINNQIRDIERKVLFRMYEWIEKKRVISVHKSDIEWNLLEYDKNIERTEIEQALSDLKRKEIIKKTVERSEYYEFTADLYRHWVKWNVPHI